MKRFKKGFTLIELLVVIAIIGILAAIVLASLSTARSKAKDAKGEGELAEMRSAAEIYYSANPSTGYGPASSNCANNMFNDTNSGMNGLTQALGGTTYGVTTNGDVNGLVCNATAGAWAAEGKLSNGNYWCVDSSGKSVNDGATAFVPGNSNC